MTKIYHFRAVLMLLCVSFVGSNKCTKEENIGNITIKWDKWEKTRSNIYMAYPHCIQGNKMFATRKCTGGVLSEDPKCESVQREISPCPHGFKIIDNDMCITILPEGTYNETKCPYNYLEPFNELRASNEAVWFPARRNIDDGVWEFSHEDYSAEYGSTLKNKLIKYKDTISSSGCLMYNASQLWAVSCQSKYKRICEYQQLHKSRKRYCQGMEAHMTGAHCMDYDFNTASVKCLCASYVMCNFAELKHPYQNYINELLPDKTCQIGIDLKENAVKWTSGDPVEYTFWSRKPVSYSDNGMVWLRNDGWTATSYSPSTCRICTIRIPYKKPKMTMTYNKADKGDKIGINVHVENPEYLIKIDGNSVYCFKDCEMDTLIMQFIPIGTTNLYAFNVTMTGYYWCKAIEMKDFETITTQRMFISIDSYNVYPMEIVVKYQDNEDPTVSSIAYHKYISKLQTGSYKVKWMKTISVDEEKHRVSYIVHFTMIGDHTALYTAIKDALVIKLKELSFIVESPELLSAQYCFEEEIIINGTHTKWDQTELGHAALSDICIDPTGLTVKRKCGGSFLTGAKWDDVVYCFVATSETTKDLVKLLSSNATTPEIISELIVITEDTSEFEPIDVSLVSQILGKLEPGEGVAENVTIIISNLMMTPATVLQTSQREMNATDRILYNFDVILQDNKYLYDDYIMETPHLISFIFDVGATNHSGLGLIRTTKGFESMKIQRNFSVNDIADIPNLEVATCIPGKILDAFNDKKVIINIFLSQALFNEEPNRKHKVVAKNFGILLQKNITLHENIPLLFKPAENINGCSCSYWRYGLQNDEPIRGKWSSNETSHRCSTRLHKCEFNHVTHFGLLVTDKTIVEDTRVLDLLTDIECGLSLFGFFGIFLTALLFKNWRRNRGNRILIYYSIVSCIQILLLYISQAVRMGDNLLFCILIGASLHYTILSQFCWMLVIAILQYRRYVTVFIGTQKWMMTKFFLVSCIFPACPVAVLLLFFRNNYIQGTGELCYPTGDGLIYAVLIPIGVVVAANMAIFFRIVLEMFCLRKNKCVDDDIFLLRLRLVVLMFFMLGVTWGFGIASQIFESPALVYIFSTTASIQGFVIFLFFIVFNENARIMYVYMWKKYNFS